MIASEARIAANRANALKSTGPRTAEGKERSRANALKHGLTGEGVALSIEDAEAIEARIAGMEADYRPVTASGRRLVRRAAMLSVRLDRCVVREAAAISMNVRAAEADFDEARQVEVNDLYELLDDDPATAVRRLSRMPEGIDRMLGTWADLRDDLIHDGGSRWSDEHGFLAVHLTGRRAGGIGIARVEALTLAVLGDFALLKPADDGVGLDARGRRAWAREAMAGLIDSTVEELKARREAIDLDAIAADRAGAGSRALFDPSKEATLARKYEGRGRSRDAPSLAGDAGRRGRGSGGGGDHRAGVGFVFAGRAGSAGDPGPGALTGPGRPGSRVVGAVKLRPDDDRAGRRGSGPMISGGRPSIPRGRCARARPGFYGLVEEFAISDPGFRVSDSGVFSCELLISEIRDRKSAIRPAALPGSGSEEHRGPDLGEDRLFELGVAASGESSRPGTWTGPTTSRDRFRGNWLLKTARPDCLAVGLRGGLPTPCRPRP